MDLQLARKLLDDVLIHPTSEDHRTVFISHINADWIGKTSFYCIYNYVCVCVRVCVCVMIYMGNDTL